MVKEYVVKVAYVLEPDWGYGCEREYVRVYVKAESTEEAIRLVDEGDREWEDELDSNDCYTVGPIEDWIVYERDKPTDILRKYAAGERNFIGVDLCEANLVECNLAEADLSGADLSGADLSGANLSRASLYDVNLYGANLSGADLSDAQLSATVPGDTEGANLSEADLTGANLSGADLSCINLSGADLSEANLHGAYLSGVNLKEAFLNQADLSQAYLSGAHLSEADLNGAKLSGANLNGADLSGANLQGTFYDEETQFPEGFDPAWAGAQLEVKDDTETMERSEVLQTARERLDTILLAIDTAKQLGCMDEGIKQALKYQVRKILLEDIIKPYLPSEWSVLDRAMYLGYNPTRAQLVAIGKEAARLYREQHGDDPPQSEEVVDGQTRLVKVYSGKAVDLLDTAIRQVMAS